MTTHANIIPSLFLDFMQMQEFAQSPMVFVAGDGIRLKTDDGRTFIDGLSGVFTASLGHRNQKIAAALSPQLGRLAFAPPLHGTNEPALELTGILLSLAPEGVGAVKLFSGGSESTEAAMKLARQYHRQTGHPRRYKILGRYGAYHGATMGALSAGGGRERKALFEPLGVGFLHVHPPSCYRCPFDQTYPSCGRTCVELIGRTIEAEDPETVAAVIVEPISISSAGFVVPPPDYLPRLRAICDRYGVVLIYDEIITGFGRVGTMFASEYYHAAPDITCCGKGMSGGYAPLAAILIRDRIAKAFYGEASEGVQFHHGHTFGGNPLACAAGLAVLGEFLARDVVNNARLRGERLRARLDAMAQRHPIIGDVRGAGLLQGIELVRDQASKEPFARDRRPGKAIERAAEKRGLLLRCGNDFVALAPPLIVTDDDIDQIAGLLDECLTDVERELAVA